MTLEAIRYHDGKLDILDQLLLPHESKYIPIENTADGWSAIHRMQVRGAPAIAIVGCLSLAVELRNAKFETKSELGKFATAKLQFLVTARPTAVNMSRAAMDLTLHCEDLVNMDGIDVEEMKTSIISSIEMMLENDVEDNKAIGRFGAEHILKSNPKAAETDDKTVTVLTHCNTGSLATANYGTALGVIRALHGSNALLHVYCTETRPYNQGARLTAYELVYEKIPSTLICDSMVAALMKTKKVSAVVVGADRVAANGDTANKIGTYQIAVVAKHHDVPFYVAAPSTSIDLTMPNGDAIVIEERPADEMTSIMGVPIAAPGIHCWNPAFDVTPAYLITGGIITEKGIFAPRDLKSKLLSGY